MILDLKKVFLIENETLSISADVDIIDCFINDTARFEGIPTAEINIRNSAGLVLFEAKVQYEYVYCCDRCGKEEKRKDACIFRHILVTCLTEDSGDDYIEAPDYKLDTDILLRDDILLELPSKFLCEKTCKGLCPKCGKNLNEGPCSCSAKETDPRLAVLKQLLSE